MKQSELSNFLQITEDGNIILPIDKYEFELSPKAAENMVVALRGALRLLAPLAPDGTTCAAPECGGDMEASLTCKVCGVTRPAGKA